MNLVFCCPNCGVKFSAPESLAGKHARCRQCKADITIPNQSTPVQSSMSRGASATQKSAFAIVNKPGVVPTAKARPVVTSQAGPKPVSMVTTPPHPSETPKPKVQNPGTPDWVTAASQVGLRPISLVAAPPVKKVLTSALDDEGFSGPYRVAADPYLPSLQPERRSGRPAGIITQAYRGQIGGLQGIVRWLNDSAYLLSIPFIAVLLFGVLLHNRPLALLAATLVVLLNISRLVTGLTNLILIPFKDSPLQGILFLIPPVGLIYCLNHWKRVHKPLKRIIEPAITVAIVAIAFTFVPWLRSNSARPTGNLTSQITSELQEFKTELKQEVKTLPQDLLVIPEKTR